MKRTHIHVNVEGADFEPSVRFYTNLFSAEPKLSHDHYAKWMLDDPALNFVVEILEVPGEVAGVHHVGIEVDTAEQLESIHAALKQAGSPLLEVGETQCCYAKSEKNWTLDPQGVRWETFRSFGQTDEYGARTPDELGAFVFGKSSERP